MSQNITVASWNIRDQLWNDAIRQDMTSLSADVIVVPEAYPESKYDSAELRTVFDEIEATTRYEVHHVLYGDADNRVDRHGLVMLVRKSLEARVYVLNIGRNVLIARVGDLYIVGVHFDDRKEATREQQLSQLLHATARWSHVVIAGDFNATHPRTGLGRFLSFWPVSWLINKLPKSEPGHPQSKAARLGSLASRLRGMTTSRLMNNLYYSGFSDVDVKKQKTKLTELPFGNIALAQLDHIVVRGMRATAFRRPRLSGSDHLLIWAMLEVN